LAGGRTLEVFSKAAACPYRVCQNTNTGLAIANEEYVPIITPMTNVKANPWMTSPPNKYSDKTARKVSPEVRIVRLRV